MEILQRVPCDASSLGGRVQPYFSVDDLHEQERAAGKRRTDEERDLVTELHPQPAAERGHENGGDMVDGLSR